MSTSSLISTVLATGLLALSMAFPAWSQEPPVAWVEDFTAPDSPHGARIFYEARRSGLAGDHLIIKEVEDGVLRYGLEFEPGRANDWANMVWGRHRWPEGEAAPWGPFDLQEFPFVEMRWRGPSPIMYYSVSTENGEIITDYYWPGATETVTDEQGLEWKVNVFRVAPDTSLPSPHTPRLLHGLNLGVYLWDTSAQLLEVDYIRVRGFTAQEQQAEQHIVRLLQDFPRVQWPEAESFFPFGIYGSQLFRGGGFEYWGGSNDEGALGVMARHHLNMVASEDPKRLGRHGRGPEGVEAFVRRWRGQIAQAQATGMRLAADLRDLGYFGDLDQGYEQLLPVTQRLAEAFGGEETICAWTLYDEPGADKLPRILAEARALAETDPDQRPALVVFNAPVKFAPYSPYLSLNYWDDYPILKGSRNPWAVRDTAQRYRELSPDVPMWAVLQTFETRPPTPPATYVRPSDAEIRLMSYLALAEGAKGLIYFHWFGSAGRDEYLVTYTGEPRGGMLATLSDLGERLIPLGQLLLPTQEPGPVVRSEDPVAETGLRLEEQIPPAEGRGLAVNVLEHRRRPLRYLIVVNEDLDSLREGTITLSPALLEPQQEVYDLYTLQEVESAEGSFTVAPLAGGDGRVYLVGDPEQFEQDRRQLLTSQALEAARVLTPDVTIARRWALDLTEVDAALAACHAAAQTGQAEEALAQAKLAGERLEALLARDSQMNLTRHALAEMRMELAELSRMAEHRSLTPRWWTDGDHPMLVPNPDFLELSSEYWRVGRAYGGLYDHYLAGDREALAADLHRTRVELLEVREEMLGYLRERLVPAEEPSEYQKQPGETP